MSRTSERAFEKAIEDALLGRDEEIPEGETARIDALVEKVRRAIGLLKGYRTALIRRP